MSAIEVRFEGKNAKESAKAFQEFLQNQFSLEVSIQSTAPPPAKEGEKSTLSNVIAITSLVISIPSAILSTQTLLEQMDSADKAKQIQQWAEKDQANHQTQCWWVSEDGKVVDLHKATPAQLIAASKACRPVPEEEAGE